MVRESEVISADSAAVRRRAESLFGDVVQMAVAAADGLQSH